MFLIGLIFLCATENVQAIVSASIKQLLQWLRKQSIRYSMLMFTFEFLLINFSNNSF